MTTGTALPHLETRAVLFDLDGTLVDTLPDLHAAVCATLTEIGRPIVTQETTRAYIGKGLRVLIRRLLAGSLGATDGEDTPQHVQALAAFRTHYARENGCHAHPYPGVVDGLRALKARGLPLGVVTNKPDVFIAPLLKKTGLSGFFDVLVGGDTLPRIKPDPMPVVWACGRLGALPKETLFVGDSLNDALAARAAGCPVFLLPYGYNEDQDVRHLDCDAIITAISDIEPHLRTVGRP